MSNFDFVLLLLSFVYALALGHLLSRVGALMLARDRVRFSGLLALAILNAVTQVYIDWLAMWDFRTLDQWDLATTTLFFVSAVLLYLMCASVAPELHEDKPLDMQAFYQRNYRLFYGLYLALLGVFVLMSWVNLRTSTPELALQQSVANLPYILICLLALFVPARWAQWTAGTALFVLSVAWPIMFSSGVD